MDKFKKVVFSVLKRAEDVITHRNVAYAVLLLSVFWFYTTIDMPSISLEYLVLTFVLMAAYFRQARQMRLAIPSFALCFIALVMLVFSGQFGVVNFNAPIHHALKFVNIFVVHVLLILMYRQSEERRRTILLVLAGLVVVGMIISVCCTLFIDEYAIRYFEERGFTLVVDFNQMYAIPFLVTAVVCGFLARVNSWKQVWIYLPFLLLTALCVYLSLYTTALLLVVMGCGLAFLFSQLHRSPKRFWIIIGVCASVVVLCFLFRQQVSDLIYTVTEEINWLVRARIRSVVDMLLGTSGDNWYTPDRRNELAGFSLTTFFNNPVFGVGYAQYGYGVIGCHQEWYDMLGVFGVVGTLAFLAVMGILTVQTFRNAKTRVDKASFLICLIMFVVLGFLNPVLNLPVLLAVYVFAPNVSLLPMPKWGEVCSWVVNKGGWIKKQFQKIKKKQEK